MEIAQRIVLWLGVVCAGASCCGGALALDPTLDVAQYAHTAWKIREGFAQGWRGG